MFEVFFLVAAKPVINPFLFMKNLQEGMRTTVVCSVLSGEPPMEIDWLKDSSLLSELHPEAKITRLGDFASSLTMDNVTRRHSGNYSCKATSGIATTNYTARMDVSGESFSENRVILIRLKKRGWVWYTIFTAHLYEATTSFFFKHVGLWHASPAASNMNNI